MTSVALVTVKPRYFQPQELLKHTTPKTISRHANLSGKPDDVRYRTKKFVGKIHGTQPKSNTIDHVRRWRICSQFLPSLVRVEKWLIENEPDY